MRALFAGEVVDHDGLVRVDRARLWTLPAQPPALIGAAVSPETARWCGAWADGLATINQPREQLERVIAAFREGGGEGKPVHVQVHLSWAPTEEEALAIAHDQWRTNVFSPPLCWDLATVEQFDEAARHVRPGGPARPGARVRRPRSAMPPGSQELAGLGAASLQLHHVGQDLAPFVAAFGERVLPAVRA